MHDDMHDMPHSILYWAARAVAAAGLLLFLVLMIGEVLAPHSPRPPRGQEWLGIIAMLVMMAGLALGFGHEVAGGLLTLAGFAAFLLLVGWVWPVALLAAAGALFLLSAASKP